MEDLNPDESSVPETAENIANLLPKYFQAFGSLDSASISLVCIILMYKLRSTQCLLHFNAHAPEDR